HNAWATATLLDFCKELSDTELNELDSNGTYGSIIDTLRHFVTAEGYYRFLVSGEWPNWEWSPDEKPGLDVLEERAKDNRAFWERFLAEGVDPDATVNNRGPGDVEYETKLGVILAQVLNHGNDHRSQISGMITELRKSPPDLQAWSYARATGRSVPRKPAPQS
ncbi:MAG: DinB family protein, partial [Actinomycetota bacterium]